MKFSLVDYSQVTVAVMNSVVAPFPKRIPAFF